MTAARFRGSGARRAAVACAAWIAAAAAGISGAAPGPAKPAPASPAPAAPASALAITDVVAEQLSLRQGSGATVSWRFRTSARARVGAWLHDARGILVRTLRSPADLAPGDQRLSWDGRDDEGRTAPPAYYVLVLEAEAGDAKVRWDPTHSTGGDFVQASDIRYDAKAGAVRFALPKPALARVLLGLKEDGPVLKTLVDWAAFGAGEHRAAWDGWDASRAIRFSDSPKLDVLVWAYSLPVNAIVVEPAGTGKAPATGEKTATAAAPARLEFLPFGSGRATLARTGKPAHEMYNHWQHDRARCHNPEVALGVPDSVPREAGGAVRAAAPVPVRLELSEGESSFLQEERFEAVIYIDGVFAFEEEQGYFPFTWTLNPDVITPGEHVVTFMIRGYEGHFGSASLRVVRPRPEGPARKPRQGP